MTVHHSKVIAHVIIPVTLTLRKAQLVVENLMLMTTLFRWSTKMSDSYAATPSSIMSWIPWLSEFLKDTPIQRLRRVPTTMCRALLCTRKYTRLPGMKKFSCHQRLANLKLKSLKLRRLRADLLFTYKLIVFGIIDLKLSDLFIADFHRASRRHQY